MIYDDGASPDKGDTQVEAAGGNRDDASARVREEMAYIHYQYNLFGLGGPRKMEVLLPQVNPQTKEKCVFLAASGGGVRRKAMRNDSKQKKKEEGKMQTNVCIFSV